MNQTPNDKGPDVRQLKTDSLPEANFPGGRNQAFRVFFSPEVHENIWKHATENTAVEICGVVVGKWVRDADGPYVLISEAIRGDAAANKFAEVTFTHETWAKINAEMDSKFAHLAIVGWYHSHPDFGIFLSDRDRFIQENFFSNPGQVAYVVDPVRKTEGVFVWKKGKTKLAPHYWVGERVQVATAAGEEEKQEANQSAASPANPESLLGAASAPYWLHFLSQLMVCFALFLLGYFLRGGQNEAALADAKANVFAQAILYYGFRYDLDEHVDKLEKHLRALAQSAAILYKDHQKNAEDQKEEMIDQWKEVEIRLNRSNQVLRDIRDSYCPTAAESQYLRALTRGRGQVLPKENKIRPEDHKGPDKTKEVPKPIERKNPPDKPAENKNPPEPPPENKKPAEDKKPDKPADDKNPPEPPAENKKPVEDKKPDKPAEDKKPPDNTPENKKP